MVLITDKFHKASNGTRAEATTLTAQKALGASSISTAALNGWATDTPVDFQLYTVDTQNNIVPGSQSDWTGIVSGTTITQLQLTGGSDDIYPIGTIVVCLPTANWADSLIEGVLLHANQNGSLVPAAVTAALTTAPAGTTQLADGSVTTAKIADNTVTNAKLSTTAGEVGGAWLTYTPTFTGFSLGNGTMTAKHTKIGKTIIGRIYIVAGSTSATTSAITFTLPTTPVGLASAEPIGQSSYKFFYGSVLYNATNTATIRWYTVSGSGIKESLFSSSSPDTMASGVIITINFTYETT